MNDVSRIYITDMIQKNFPGRPYKSFSHLYQRRVTARKIASELNRTRNHKLFFLVNFLIQFKSSFFHLLFLIISGQQRRV